MTRSMSTIKSLVKDTAVYGLSSMFGRFLNWLLTYVYSRILIPPEFGQMTKLYAWIALLLVILTYGMETSFFRFANKSDHPKTVYSTTLWSLGISSLLFMGIGLLCLSDITSLLGVQAEQSSLILMMIVISAMDAFTAIPLGYLRLKQRPWRFMFVRMSFVILTIVLTLSVFYGIPYLQGVIPGFASWYSPREALFYILGINVIGNLVQLVLLLPELRESDRSFDGSLLKEMLRYSWPILLLGLVGAFSNQADKILFPMLFDDPLEGDTQLGIYGACYKLAVIMVLFTQAFRYAYDPFVFSKSREGDEAKVAYAQSMRYYVIFTLFIFLGVMSTLDVLKYFIDGAYFAGLPAVPLVMIGQLMFGVYFNLSLWYKLTDRTLWGAILSILGSVIAVLMIVLYAKEWGFMACAWASVVSNAVIMLVSYFLGQRYYPINYPLKAIAGYALLTAGLYGVEQLIAMYAGLGYWFGILVNLLLLTVFILVVIKYEINVEDLRSAVNKVLKRR